MSSLLVKGILVEKVGAVKLLAMSLVEGDYVFFSFEYFNLSKWFIKNKRSLQSKSKRPWNSACLICHLSSTPDKLPSPCDRYWGLDVCGDGLIIVCVSKNDVRDPNTGSLHVGEGVKGFFWLEVVVEDPVFIPLEGDSQLEVNGVTLLWDGQHVHQAGGYIHQDRTNWLVFYVNGERWHFLVITFFFFKHK